MKLNVRSFALTTGIVWGVLVFILTWWMLIFEGSQVDPGLLGKLYRGYSISPGGSFIGLLWAFVDGLVIGAVFAWLYNIIIGRK